MYRQHWLCPAVQYRLQEQHVKSQYVFSSHFFRRRTGSCRQGPQRVHILRIERARRSCTRRRIVRFEDVEGYSRKSFDCASITAPISRVARADRRATPTTPKTFISARDVRGINMCSTFPCKSGGVSRTPVSSSSRRLFATMPSIESSSRNRSRTHNPSSFGRLRKVFRSGSNGSLNSRTKSKDL